MGQYINPPESVRLHGRALRSSDKYADLAAQLQPGELLFGLLLSLNQPLFRLQERPLPVLGFRVPGVLPAVCFRSFPERGLLRSRRERGQGAGHPALAVNGVRSST